MPTSDTAPSIRKVTVKNFRPVERLSEETLAFTATIYVNDRRAGRVSNEGTGGCNRYDFDSRAMREAFMAYARAWGREHDVLCEPEDALIAQRCEDYEFRRAARKVIAQHRAAALVVIQKRPVWGQGRSRSSRPSYYRESYAVPLRDGEDAASVAEREQAAAWRLIPVDG